MPQGVRVQLPPLALPGRQPLLLNLLFLPFGSGEGSPRGAAAHLVGCFGWFNWFYWFNFFDLLNWFGWFSWFKTGCWLHRVRSGQVVSGRIRLKRFFTWAGHFCLRRTGRRDGIVVGNLNHSRSGPPSPAGAVKSENIRPDGAVCRAETMRTGPMSVVCAFGNSALRTRRSLALAACGTPAPVAARLSHGMVDLGTAWRWPYRSHLSSVDRRPCQREPEQCHGPQLATDLPYQHPRKAWGHVSMHDKHHCDRFAYLRRQSRCSRQSLRDQFIVRTGPESLRVSAQGWDRHRSSRRKIPFGQNGSCGYRLIGGFRCSPSP